MKIEMVDPFITTALSILSAIVAAILGYLKNRPNEDFDQDKFLHTVLIGVAIGIVQVMLNVAPGSAEGWVTMFLIQTGIIDTVERALKALWAAYQNKDRGGRTVEYVEAKNTPS
jgi:hypothetical protein